MKNIIYFFFVVILFVSCTSRTIYKKPKNLIGKDKMIALWTDIYIAKGAYSVKMKDSRKNINYIPLVLEKHEVDSIQFSQSNVYYTSRIAEYEKMFEEVRKRLEEIKKPYLPESKPRKDSLLIKEPKDKLNKYPRKKLLQEKVKN